MAGEGREMGCTQKGLLFRPVTHGHLFRPVTHGEEVQGAFLTGLGTRQLCRLRKMLSP